jgi:hypothetical protein
MFTWWGAVAAAAAGFLDQGLDFWAAAARRARARGHIWSAAFHACFLLM